jgi:cystathionine beta-lyase family protein involved in aluminum resistance
MVLLLGVDVALGGTAQTRGQALAKVGQGLTGDEQVVRQHGVKLLAADLPKFAGHERLNRGA